MTQEIIKAEDYGLDISKANELTVGLKVVKAERELLITEFEDVSKLELTQENLPKFKELTIEDINPLSGEKKKRKIWIPNKPMKELHREVLRMLEKKKIELRSAAGGLPGNSPRKNVLRHQRQPSLDKLKKANKGNAKINTTLYFPRYWFMTDISNAFGILLMLII